MTAPRRDGKDEHPFSKWSRSDKIIDSRTEGIYASDTDVWHGRYLRYKDRQGLRTIQHCIEIEVKNFGKEIDANQLEMISFHQQIREKLVGKPHKVKDRNGKPITFYDWGIHTLICSGASPKDSATLIWDGGRFITIDQLRGILRFELDPRTLEPRDPGLRRHHVNKTPQFPGMD